MSKSNDDISTIGTYLFIIPDTTVREKAVGDGGHGVFSHSVVKVTAGSVVLLEPIGLALQMVSGKAMVRQTVRKVKGRNDGLALLKTSSTDNKNS